MYNLAHTEVLPGLSKPGICPNALGARNLMAAAYNARSRLVFLPITDTCRLPDGSRWQKTPQPGSEGKYGMMQAIAEGFELLNKSEFNLDLKAVAGVWNRRTDRYSELRTAATAGLPAEPGEAGTDAPRERVEMFAMGG